MSEEHEELITHFVPPLGTLLAMQEEQKGSALTQDEVSKIRDEAPCVMIPAQTFADLRKKNDYAEIHPENAFDDWQRFKCDYGLGYLPVIILSIPGNEDFKSKASKFLADKKNITFEFNAKDPDFAFHSQALSGITEFPINDDDVSAINKHTCILNINNAGFGSKSAPNEALRMMQLANELVNLGGSAVRVHSSGIAHSPTSWQRVTSIAERHPREDLNFWNALFRAYVQLPIQSEKSIYTCGMHLLGHPELVTELKVLQETQPKLAIPKASYELFSRFAHYLLAECQNGEFWSNHTYQSDFESPSYRIFWEECSLYEVGTAMHNPYGMWRFKSLEKKVSLGLIQKLFFKK